MCEGAFLPSFRERGPFYFFVIPIACLMLGGGLIWSSLRGGTVFMGLTGQKNIDDKIKADNKVTEVGMGLGIIIVSICHIPRANQSKTRKDLAASHEPTPDNSFRFALTRARQFF